MASDSRTHTMIAERLSEVTTLHRGAHDAGNGEMCAMEAAAYVAGEPWSDHPECVCPVIAAFMRAWNDGLPDNASRDRLLLPLIPAVIGTRSIKAVERRRATMAMDWLIRTHTVAWLRLARLNSQADALASLPEITDFAQCPALMPTLQAVRKDADAAWDAARAAARAAAWDAAWDAAGDAAGAAAWDAARDAAGDAAWAAARAAARAAAGDAAGAAAWAAARAAAWDAARAAAWDAARAAAWDAARDAAGDALAGTTAELQQSAVALVERMAAVTETDRV